MKDNYFSPLQYGKLRTHFWRHFFQQTKRAVCVSQFVLPSVPHSLDKSQPLEKWRWHQLARGLGGVGHPKPKSAPKVRKGQSVRRTWLNQCRFYSLVDRDCAQSHATLTTLVHALGNIWSALCPTPIIPCWTTERPTTSVLLCHSTRHLATDRIFPPNTAVWVILRTSSIRHWSIDVKSSIDSHCCVGNPSIVSATSNKTNQDSLDWREQFVTSKALRCLFQKKRNSSNQFQNLETLSHSIEWMSFAHSSSTPHHPKQHWPGGV